VVIYRFSIHNAAGGDRETVGRMALADDNAVRAFGEEVIRDMMRSLWEIRDVGSSAYPNQSYLGLRRRTA